MAVRTIKLSALKLEVPIPETLEIHNEGYISTYEFYSKFIKASTGREITLRESMNLPTEFGAYESYAKTDGIRVEHVHYYVIDALKNLSPFNNYVSAHEEAEILVREGLIARPDIFIDRLKSLGVNANELPDTRTEFHKIGHIGGLAFLLSENIALGSENDEKWMTFVKQTNQSENMNLESDFKEAFNWVKERIN